MPELFDEAYKALGEDFHKVLDLRRCDPIYNIYFDDNQLLATTNDLGEMKLRLEQIERGSFCSFLRYMEEGHHHFYQSIWHVVGMLLAM
jgi:phytoene dehydrogenase-like protein